MRLRVDKMAIKGAERDRRLTIGARKSFMKTNAMTRRAFAHCYLLPLLGAALTAPTRPVAASGGSSTGPSRRQVIKQRLPGDPPRDVTLVEVHYPPGTGSPVHVHANGVIGFLVSGSIISKVDDGPEQTFRAGDAWWEPSGAIHRVSRNASLTDSAKLLAIYIAPSGTSESDLMKPI